jgi:hypothetical protein
MASIRDSILSALDRKPQPISIPEWNVECFIRAWSATDHNNFLANFSGVSSKDASKVFALNMDARALILGLADQEGRRLFQDSDLDAILEKKGEVVSRVGQACMKYNGIGNTDELKNG